MWRKGCGRWQEITYNLQAASATIILNNFAQILNKQAQIRHLLQNRHKDWSFSFLCHRNIPTIRARLRILTSYYKVIKLHTKPLLSLWFPISPKALWMSHAPVRHCIWLKEKALVPQAFSISSSHLIQYPKYFHVWDPAKTNVRIPSFQASVKLNQILWVNLIAVKNYINLWIGHIVHATVIKVGEAGILGGWSAVHGMTDCVFPNKHSGQEHGFVGRLTSKYWWGESVSLQGGVVLPCGVTELTGVFGVPGKVAPCRRERHVKKPNQKSVCVVNFFHDTTSQHRRIYLCHRHHHGFLLAASQS